MAKFRKKPVEIQAIPVREALAHATNSWRDMPDWMRDSYDRGEVLFLGDRVEIKTLEGRMTGLADDWIIQGVKGEIYPCKPDIFAATYDEVA